MSKKPKFPVKLDCRVTEAFAKRLRKAAKNCEPPAKLGVYMRYVLEVGLDEEARKKICPARTANNP